MIDITGQTFGKLTAIKQVEDSRAWSGGIHWICRCECGNIIQTPLRGLLRGTKTHCGCVPKIDITGKTFARLTVRKYLGQSPTSRAAMWLCDCVCGNQIEAAGGALRKGGVTGCGCDTPYVMTNPRELRNTWRLMINRCHNPKAHNYKHYGARGIYVCDRWRDSFDAFIEDMFPRPYGLTLDRVDVDGPYCKENCTWATVQEQAQNRTSSLAYKASHTKGREAMSEKVKATEWT